MGKIIVDELMNRYRITNRLENGESLNERITNTIATGAIQEFFPLTIKRKRRECFLEAQVSGMVSVNYYFCGVISKKAFLDLVYRLVCVIKKCENNMMNPNNIDLDIRRIFLDPSTKEIRCLYWPIVNNTGESSPKKFFRELVNSAILNPYEEKDFINEYVSFFRGTEPFSIHNFERLILKLQGRPTITRIDPADYDKNHPSEKLEPKKEEKEPEYSIAYDPFSQFAAEDHQESNWKQPLQRRDNIRSETDHAGIYSSRSDVGTTVLGCDVGGTTVLGFQSLDKPQYPYMIRKRTNEKFSIDKPVFRIGKERKYCDYFVVDNNAVSRSHADIITKDKRYYIVDLHSTNRTYIDGRVIPIEQEIEIFSGTEIRLANEDFVFYVE